METTITTPRPGAAALGALIGAAALPQAHAGTVEVPWTGPDTFEVVGPPPESITFTPIANIDGFLGISGPAVVASEGTWSILIDLNGTWQSIYTGTLNGNLNTIPPANFAEGTLSGIEFSGPLIALEYGMASSVFSFDQVATVPEPAGLPIFATAFAALGVCLRRAGIRRR